MKLLEVEVLQCPIAGDATDRTYTNSNMQWKVARIGKRSPKRAVINNI